MRMISEEITPEKIYNWKNTDIITITAGTGAGKSYFIKNRLFLIAKEQGKKILMLIHRVNCVDQFRKEIIRDGKSDTIDIMTYQSIESLNQNHKKEFDFSEYAYIVCDEFHYFLSDAAFSKQTDVSLNKILSQTNITRIFMSATGDYMKRFLNNIKRLQTIDYDLPIEYSFIKEITFFNKDETLEKFIQQAIDNNDKGIFFIQSAKKAFKLYQKFKEYCLFNCGKSDPHYKYVHKEKIDSMLVNEKFGELILITTTCLDSGVNLKDIDLKHVVCDVDDVNVLIQCIGRKRIQNEDDMIHLYIKSISNQKLGSKESQLKNKIQMAEFLKDHTVKEYIEQFPKKNDYNNIVYDVTTDEDDKCSKKINDLMYYKCKFDLSDIALMKNYGKFGFCKYLMDLFGYKKRYRLIEEDYIKDDLNNYLNSIVGKRLFRDEQKHLINMIGLKDARGRIQKSFKQFNAYFEENNMRFLIESKRSSERVDGKVRSFRYWEILNK